MTPLEKELLDRIERLIRENERLRAGQVPWLPAVPPVGVPVPYYVPTVPYVTPNPWPMAPTITMVGEACNANGLAC